MLNKIIMSDFVTNVINFPESTITSIDIYNLSLIKNKKFFI